MQPLPEDPWFTVDRVDDATFAISEYGHWQHTRQYAHSLSELLEDLVATDPRPDDVALAGQLLAAVSENRTAIIPFPGQFPQTGMALHRFDTQAGSDALTLVQIFSEAPYATLKVLELGARQFGQVAQELVSFLMRGHGFGATHPARRESHQCWRGTACSLLRYLRQLRAARPARLPSRTTPGRG
jgi:hypothetical protein